MQQSEGFAGLIEKARRGDHRAFERIVLRFNKHVTATVSSEFGRTLRRRVEVDDLVQETFLQAFRSIEQFRGECEGTLQRWLSTIARHVVQGQGRKMTAKKAGFQREIDVPVSSIEDVDTTPTKGPQREERFERLKAAIGSLRPSHRQVITLARLKGLPIKETARRMGRSEKATSVLLVRAMLKLRKAFGDTESLHLPRRGLTEDFESDRGQ